MSCWPDRVLILACLFFTGCAGLPEAKKTETASSPGAMVVGFIQVKSTGPHFRMHQAEPVVRFFDAVNSKTGERTRVHIPPQSQRFVERLAPGPYEVIRIQIGEGPFQSESLINMTFQVKKEEVGFLGIWQLRVDPPKTVRMLHWDVVAKSQYFDPTSILQDAFKNKPIGVSLPHPSTHQTRLFAVAPSQPRAKYFYRR